MKNLCPVTQTRRIGPEARNYRQEKFTGTRVTYHGKPLYLRRDDEVLYRTENPPPKFIRDVVAARRGDQAAISRIHQRQLTYLKKRLKSNESWQKQGNYFVLKEPLRYAEVQAILALTGEKMDNLRDERGYETGLTLSQFSNIAGLINSIGKLEFQLGVITVEPEYETYHLIRYTLCKARRLPRLS